MKVRTKKELNQKVCGWVTKFTYFFTDFTSSWRKKNWNRYEKEQTVDKIFELMTEARFLNEHISHRDNKPEYTLVRDFQAWADYYNWFNHSPREISYKLLNFSKKYPVKYGYYLVKK